MPRDFFGEKHYSMKEASEILGVSYVTINRYRRVGLIKGVKIGKFVWFSENELREFVKTGEKE